MARRVMGDSRSEAEKAFKSATTKPPDGRWCTVTGCLIRCTSVTFDTSRTHAGSETCWS